jgi:hypothetical protein
MEILRSINRKRPPSFGQLLRRVDPGLANQALRDVAEVVTARQSGVGRIPKYLEEATIRYWRRRLGRGAKKGYFR